MNSQASFEPDRFVSPAFALGLVAGGWGSTEIIHHVNQTGEYNPIHNQVLALEQDNHQITAKLHDPHLSGFTGTSALHKHLQTLQTTNNLKISTLQAREPQQVISQGAETAIEAGSAMLVGVAVLAAFVFRARKIARLAKAKGSQLEEFSTENTN